jgi:hypothetical protein
LIGSFRRWRSLMLDLAYLALGLGIFLALGLYARALARL